MVNANLHIDSEVTSALSAFLQSEFLMPNPNNVGLKSQKEVKEALTQYSKLKGFAESDDNFIATITHAGNIAKDGLRPNSAEPWLHKISRSLDSTKGEDYATESYMELLHVLPAVLNGILESDVQDNPQDLYKGLKSKKIIQDGAYRFSPRLIGALKNLALMVAVEN